MANIYVRSTDGNDADNGSTWALAKATIGGAVAIAAAGDTIWVSQSHAETSATSFTWTLPNTPADPVKILCGNDAAEPPTALATSATVAQTGNNQNIVVNGYGYIYGLTFNLGSGANSSTLSAANSTTNGHGLLFEQCNVNLLTTQAGARLSCGVGSTGADDCFVQFRTCAVTFGNTGQKLSGTNRFAFINVTFAASGSVPTVLFTPSTGVGGGDVTFDRCDFSALGSGKAVVDLASAVQMSVTIVNSKIGASGSFTTGTHPGGIGGVTVRVINSGPDSTNYRYHFENYLGTVDQETTIVRTGGATDGTTPVSRKFASSANARWFQPLSIDLATLWNDSLLSQTLTVEVITDGVTLTDAEMWVEVDYPSDSSFPLYSVVRDRSADFLAAGASQASSSEAWTTTGLTTPTKQKLEVTFTAVRRGPLYVRVCLAKVSQTVYVCPKVKSASGRQFLTPCYINDDSTRDRIIAIPAL